MVNKGFSVHNIHLYLRRQTENTNWILYGRKIGDFGCTNMFYEYCYPIMNSNTVYTVLLFF